MRSQEKSLAERERQLNEQSAMSQQQLQAEREKIAEERLKALADAKKQGLSAAAAASIVAEEKQ